MSPVGGPGARRLRGVAGAAFLHVRCFCGEEYTVTLTAVDMARCPNNKCKRPTRDVPRVKSSQSGL